MTHHRTGAAVAAGRVGIAAAVLLAAVLPPAAAGVERAPDRSVATTCAELRTIAEAAAPDREGVRLLFEGPVARIERDGAMALVFVCGGDDATAACLEYRDGGLAVGDRVRVHGLVAGTWDKGPMLDPCGTTRVN
jgi:hypothetical protein